MWKGVLKSTWCYCNVIKTIVEHTDFIAYYLHLLTSSLVTQDTFMHYYHRFKYL